MARRDPGTALRAAAAGLALAAVVAGVPLLFAHTIGFPVPQSLWSAEQWWTALTTPDLGGHLLLKALTWIAWAAWAAFTLSVLIEIPAQLRGRHAPQLPTLGLQRPAAGLVALVLAGILAPQIFLTGTALGATPTPMPAPTSTSSVTTTALSDRPITDPVAAPAAARQATVPAAEASATPGQDPTATAAAPTAGEEDHVTVVPGDTLWEIAETTLGDGSRYPELAAATADDVQPGGGHLVDPDLIYPGWTIDVPAVAATTAPATAPAPTPASPVAPDAPTATAPGSDIATPGTSPTAGGTQGDISDAAPAPAQSQTPAQESPAQPWTTTATPTSTPSAIPSAGGVLPAPTARATTADLAPATTASSGTTPSGTTTGVQLPDITATTASTAENAPDDTARLAVLGALGITSLIAAPILGRLLLKRRRQLAQRPIGHPVPTPDPDAATLERDLRSVADPLSADRIDAALRALGAHAAATGTAIPELRLARWAGTDLELYLDQPTHLPAPWQATDDPTQWVLDTTGDLTPAPEGTPSPYPALVTLGQDPHGSAILIDLEYLGSLLIEGDPTTATAILTGICLNLIEASWSDDLQVTLVGLCADLPDKVAVDHVRYIEDVDRLLLELTARAHSVAAALDEADLPDLASARSLTNHHDTWAPEVVLLATPLTAAQHDQLQVLLEHLPRVGLASVATAVVGIGESTLTINADDHTQAVLDLLAQTITTQRISTRELERYLELHEHANAPVVGEGRWLDGTPAVEPTLAEVRAVPVQDTDTSTAVAGWGLPAGVLAEIDPATEATTSTGTATAAMTKGVAVAVAASDSTPATNGDDPGDGGRNDEVELGDHDLEDGDAPRALDDGDGEQDSAVAVPGQPGDHDADDHPTSAHETTELVDDEGAEPAPMVRVLGQVDILHTRGVMREDSRGGVATDLAAFVALHTAGVTTAQIDGAFYGGVASKMTRNPVTSKLRTWLGKDDDGQPYLTLLTKTRYHYRGDCDWAVFQDLVERGDIESLEGALSLVRGRPFGEHNPDRYRWVQVIETEMTGRIVDVAAQVAHHRLVEGRPRAALTAAVQGLRVADLHEGLWRYALSAHDRIGDRDGLERAIAILRRRLGDLGYEPEPATEQLIRELTARTPSTSSAA